METEDVSLAIVRFENGGVASVVNSVLSPRQTSYLRCDFADVPSSHEAQRRALVASYRTGERPAASDADGGAGRPTTPSTAA